MTPLPCPALARRRFAAGCLALTFLLPPLAGAPAPAVGAADAARPNIIFLMADDLGWGDVGAYGQRHIRTPHVDQLAREGLRFTDVYAGGSVCAPSRSVLMTGQHLGHTRVRGNSGMTGGVGEQRRVPLEPEDVTVAMLLRQAGYATGITGKWGLGEPGTTGIPNRKGFDEWFGYLNQQHAHTYYTDHLWRNEERVTLQGNLNGQTKEYSHDLFAEFTLDYVRRHRDRPFFLYLAWTLPHGKYVVPSLETYGDRDWPQDYKVHAAMVTRLDRDLGRLLALLRELDLERRTLVFFCSDNGGVDRREGVLDSVGPFRGKKGVPYEGGLRVPMIVRWPGRIAPGTVSSAPWYFADVLPTLCELGGAKVPGGVDGVSVLPTLLGREQPELRTRKLYWEQYSGGGFQQAARWGRWKGHLQAGRDQFELYDLEQDQMEARNVAAAHPEVVRELRAYFAAAHVPSANWHVRPPATKR